MKRLHIYLIKSYIGPLLMTFMIALFILLMQFLWKYIDDLVGKGLEWFVIVKLLFYALSTFVPLALPLAVLLSSLMTFGNLGERYELVGMKGAGISLRKIMNPLVFVAVMITGCGLYFSNYILPVANLKMRSLLYDVREVKPSVNIKEGVFYNGINNYVIRIGGKGKDGRTIDDVMIFDHSERMGNNNVTIAERGIMDFTEDRRFLIFHLYKGVNYTEELSSRDKEEKRPLQRTEFGEEYVRIDLSEFAMTRTSEDLFKGNYTMLNLRQLGIVEDSLKRGLRVSNERFGKKFRGDYLYYYTKMSNQSSVDSRQSTVVSRQSTVVSPQSKVVSRQSPVISPQTKVVSRQSEVVSRQPEVVSKDNKSLKNFSNQVNLSSDMLGNVGKGERVGVIEGGIELARRGKEGIFFEGIDEKNREGLIRKHIVEWHRKFTLSVACFIFFLIGAPLGAIIRRGGFGLPVVVSTLFFLVYHVISIIGEKFTREGVFQGYIGMWLSTIVMLPIGVVIVYKAMTDSTILDAEGWKKFFRKFKVLKVQSS